MQIKTVKTRKEAEKKVTEINEKISCLIEMIKSKLKSENIDYSLNSLRKKEDGIIFDDTFDNFPKAEHEKIHKLLRNEYRIYLISMENYTIIMSDGITKKPFTINAYSIYSNSNEDIIYGLEMQIKSLRKNTTERLIKLY